MAKSPALQRANVVKWFGEQSFEAQDKVLNDLSAVFKRGKAEKIKALEAELARLKDVPVEKKKPANGINGHSPKANPLKGRKIAPKYRHPKERTKTWAGRGVQPAWVAEYVKGGGKLTDLLIRR